MDIKELIVITKYWAKLLNAENFFITKKSLKSFSVESKTSTYSCISRWGV